MGLLVVIERRRRRRRRVKGTEAETNKGQQTLDVDAESAPSSTRCQRVPLASLKPMAPPPGPGAARGLGMSIAHGGIAPMCDTIEHCYNAPRSMELCSAVCIQQLDAQSTSAPPPGCTLCCSMQDVHVCMVCVHTYAWSVLQYRMHPTVCAYAGIRS